MNNLHELQNELLNTALEYQRLGFSIIPITPKDKKPIIKWIPYQEKRATEEEVRNWWNEWSNANIGIITGKISGIVVIDIDTEEIPDWVPGTVYSKTAKGTHHYFKYDSKYPIRNSVKILGKKIDVRGDGGYIVAPPSIHPSGGKYKWLETLDISNLADFPYDILDKQEKLTIHQKESKRSLDKNNLEGSRNNATAKKAGSLVKKIDESLWDTAGWEELKRWNQEKNKPPLDEEELKTTFESIKQKELGSQKSENTRKSQATQLFEVLEKQNIYLFKSDRSEPYISFKVNDHIENHPCEGTTVSYWIRTVFWNEFKKTINQQSKKDVQGNLSAKALFDGNEHVLTNRTALDIEKDEIWYDLSNQEWESVCITKEGWELVHNPPILFRRYNHQCPQVKPKKGGEVERLFDFVNIKDENQKILLLTWLISCFIPDFPHPILLVHGSQGSAKSFLSKICRKIIDPSRLETMSFPKSQDELVQQLDHHWCSLYDNLTWLHQWASDVLCRAVTGEGNSKRQLYTNDDDVIFSYKRCVILNGINVPSEQSDLLERSILLELERIPEEERQEENKLLKDFNNALPEILGGVFDVLVKALEIRPKIKLDKCPRMADFTLWGCAIAEAIGYGQIKFLEAYWGSVQKNNERVIYQNPVAILLFQFMKLRFVWEGRTSKLLSELKEIAHKENISEKELPQAANALARKLNTIKPDLERYGIKILEVRSKAGGRLLHITYTSNIKKTENIEHIEQADKTDSGRGGFVFDTPKKYVSKSDTLSNIEQNTDLLNPNREASSDDMSDMSDKICPTKDGSDIATAEYVADLFGGEIIKKKDDEERDEYGMVKGGYLGFPE